MGGERNRQKQPEFIGFDTQLLHESTSNVRFAVEKPYWELSESLHLPNFDIEIKGFAEGKERPNLNATGDGIHLKIIRYPGKFTHICYEVWDNFSEADKRASSVSPEDPLKIWRPLAAKYKATLSQVVRDVLNTKIPQKLWEYPDVAGSILVNGINRINKDFDERIFEVLITNLFNEIPETIPDLALGSIINNTSDYLGGKYIRESQIFSSFAQEVAAKTNGEINPKLLKWYLNGAHEWTSLLILESKFNKLSRHRIMGNHPVIFGHFGSSADVSSISFKDNDELIFNTNADDNNAYIEKLINRLMELGASKEEIHEFIIAKPDAGPYSSLDTNIDNLYNDYNNSFIMSMLRQNSGSAAITYVTTQISLGVYSDGFDNQTTDLSRNINLSQDIPYQFKVLQNQKAEAVRKYLKQSGYTTDDRGAGLVTLRFE